MAEETTADVPVPNDEDVTKARATSARQANLEKARRARSEKSKARKASASESGGPSSAAQSPAPASDGVLLAGCRAFVRFCWLLSRLGAYAAGGKLAPLSDSELDEGAKEAVTIVSRFAFLASVLAFLGFPLWLVRQLAEKFTHTPRPEVAQAPAQSTEPAPAGSNVVQLGAAK